MTAAERQAAAVRVLVAMDTTDDHTPRCPYRDPGHYCPLCRLARAQAKALDEAGLLCALVEEAS